MSNNSKNSISKWQSENLLVTLGTRILPILRILGTPNITIPGQPPPDCRLAVRESYIDKVWGLEGNKVDHAKGFSGRRRVGGVRVTSPPGDGGFKNFRQKIIEIYKFSTKIPKLEQVLHISQTISLKIIENFKI